MKKLSILLMLALSLFFLAQCDKPSQKNNEKKEAHKEVKKEGNAVSEIKKEVKKKVDMGKEEIEKLSSELKVSDRSILFDGEEKKEENK